jgi:hypothetical protein
MFYYPTPVTLYRKVKDPDDPTRYLKDDYGKFQLIPTEIKVALSLRENIVKDRDGNERKTFMDVDFPPHIEFDYGDQLEYIDDFGRKYVGEVYTLEENTDPLGIRVLSRFASIGYQ